jgi:hypothetical protein
VRLLRGDGGHGGLCPNARTPGLRDEPGRGAVGSGGAGGSVAGADARGALPDPPEPVWLLDLAESIQATRIDLLSAAMHSRGEDIADMGLYRLRLAQLDQILASGRVLAVRHRVLGGTGGSAAAPGGGGGGGR